ncbi:hypothetical protein D3C86_1065540 [compost metagenome]
MGDGAGHRRQHVCAAQQHFIGQQRDGFRDGRGQGQALLREVGVDALAQGSFGRGQDPILARERGRGDPRGLRQRMPRSRDHADRFVIQHFGPEHGLGRAQHQPSQHAIEFAAGQAGQQGVVCAFVQHDGDAGMIRAHPLDGARHQHRQRHRLHAHPDAAAGAGGQGGDLVARAGQVGQQHVCLAGQRVAKGGGGDAAARARKEDHAEHVLELQQQLAGRGLRHPQARRGLVHAAQRVQRLQQVQVAQAQPPADVAQVGNARGGRH